MSRTKEGRETNQTPSRQVDRTPTDQTTNPDLNQQQSRGGYITGRESRRDFPRRSTSLRAANEDFRNRYGRGQNYQTQTENRNRYYREQPYQTSEDYREGSSDLYSREKFGRPRRETYGRAESDYYNRRNRDFDRDQGPRDNYYTKSFNPRYGEYEREGQPNLARYGGSFTRDYENPVRSGGRLYETDYDGEFEDRREWDRGRSGRDYGRDYDRSYRGRETSQYNTDQYYSGQYNSGQYNTPYNYPAEGQFTSPWYSRNYLRCQDVMTTDVTTCSSNTNLREVANRLEDENVGSLPVVDNGRLVGIVTDRDIVCRVLAEGGDTRQATAAGAMSEDVVTCTPDESVIDAIRKMGQNQIRRIPIIDHNGRLKGIIAMADIALEAERDRELANALERISQPTPSRSRNIRH